MKLLDFKAKKSGFKYSLSQFFRDIVSGLSVAVITLPLAISLAFASGVGPKEGIYTAIIAGFIVSIFGGSKVQIAGPTAALATVVSGIVVRSGTDGLILATLCAGVILILMGVLRLGNLIKFIPYTITVGFTAGIALIIVIGQLKGFFGLTYPDSFSPVETFDKVSAFFVNIGTINYQALLVGLISIAILIAWPKIKKVGTIIPASLIAPLVGILLVKLVGLRADTIGDIYNVNNVLPTIHVPQITMDSLRNASADGFSIAILVAIESLLSCTVADSMINSHHRANQELIAQGVGNIASVLVGGIPAAGTITGTATNIKNGGRSFVAGVIRSGILVLVLIFLMPYVAFIPIPTIAAILFMLAYEMCGIKSFLYLCKTSPIRDIVVLAVTFIITVCFDLVAAIGVGMVAACILLMSRMAEEAEIKGWKSFDPSTDPDNIELKHVPRYVHVYEISGPMLFGAAERIAEINTKEYTRVLVVRMRSVPTLDAAAMHSLKNLYDRCCKKGIRMIFSHVNEQPYNTMEKAGYVDVIGRENFCANIDEALQRAEQLEYGEISQPTESDIEPELMPYLEDKQEAGSDITDN